MTKLCDLNKREQPKQKGMPFRSLQIFICSVCGGKTNNLSNGVPPMGGPFIYCANAGKKWHEVLAGKFRLASQPHPKSYLRDLEEDIEGILKDNKEDIKNDLVGTPDYLDVRSF